MSHSPKRKPNGAGLWIGVGVGFGLLLLAYVAMFYFSSKHRPATVPLEFPVSR
jgi:hypothetical protein